MSYMNLDMGITNNLYKNKGIYLETMSFTSKCTELLAKLSYIESSQIPSQ